MNIFERNNNHPLTVLHEAKKIHTTNLNTIDSEEAGEYDSSLEDFKCPCKNHTETKICKSANENLRNVKKRDFSISLDFRGSKTKEEGQNESEKGQCAETETHSCRSTAEETTVRSKKKKRRRCLTICTSNCKYDVVRRIASRFGMKEVTEDSSWNLYWTDLSISIDRAKDLKRYQKVNHFPGMTEICRKDLLARNLNRMLRLFPKDYNFFPKTWCFPADHGDAMNYAKLRRTKTFIVKPDTGCQGRGIYLTKNLKDVKMSERMICQVYVAKPYLIDGYKFDLRIYTLITSCDPLRIYVYNEGLARFATSRYKEPTGHNVSNVFMHLTNYAVNKHSRLYIEDDEIGSKRKISTLNKWMKAKDIDVNDLWSRIDEIIVKTILAAYPVLKHSYRACFPTHDRTYACFELLGFDVLLDWKLKPYLLEVNHSPSFHTDAQIDKEIKEGLLSDTFEMLNLHECDKRKIIEEDRKRVRERLLNTKDTSPNDTISGPGSTRADCDHAQRQFEWEDEHTGNFRRIYPCEDGAIKYSPYFKQSGTFVFQETVASRAREEAVKAQKEENEAKTKDRHEIKRTFGKWNEPKPIPESPNASRKSCRTLNRQKSGRSQEAMSKKGSFVPAMPRASLATASSMKANVYSFEPEIISETEERERLNALAQRDFLVKSYGILEQIYMAMKINGTLRGADERRFNLYGKPGRRNDALRYAETTYGGRMHQCRQHDPTIQPEKKLASLTDDCSQCTLKANLKVTRNVAPVYARSKIPDNSSSTEGLRSSNQNGRITKTHVVRTLSNSTHLRTIEKRETNSLANK